MIGRFGHFKEMAPGVHQEHHYQVAKVDYRYYQRLRWVNMGICLQSSLLLVTTSSLLFFFT